MKNIVIGCSGLIGREISKRLPKKDTLFISRKKPECLKNIYWKKVDLDKKINNLPFKIDKVFFLSSPYYIKKNINKKILNKEYLWLKKILNKIKINHFIYFSSSSVYIKKHPVGQIKLKCEKLLKKSRINIIQIWRPFNIVGYYQNGISDHFHNLLIKYFIKRKFNSKKFLGNGKDRRGYSSVKNLCKTVINLSKNKKNFIMNYGNSNTITVEKIAEIFSKLLKERLNREINIRFSLKKKNINTINSSKMIKTIRSNEDSEKILKNYFLKLIK